MRRLRRRFQRWVRRLGPPLVVVVAVVLFGFGSHAALDWHRHGSPGAGFFHLHAHAGDHHHAHAAHHDEHGHHHHGDLHHEHHSSGPAHHEPGSPAPDSPSDRQDDTFTIAFGVAPASAAAAVVAPVVGPDGRQNPRLHVRIAHEHAKQPWIPRGPPV